MVHTMTSVTTKRSREFNCSLGNFKYYQVGADYYKIGLKIAKEKEFSCIVASPEKALCDLIIYDNFVPNQSVRTLWQYLEEDIRFDTDELKNFDISIIEECVATGRKASTLNNLIKIIKKL